MTLIERLNEAYARRATREALDPWWVRPSGLGGCLRESAWILSGAAREPRSPESLRLLDLGSQRGQALEALAKSCWPDAEAQVAVDIPTPWGSMPGTIDLWIPSLRTIVDFKTAGAYAMGKALSGEENEGYALQLNAYRHGIAIRLALDISGIHTVLVYEAKDSDARKGVQAGMLHEVEIPYTAALEEAYSSRLKQFESLLEAQRGGSLNPLEVPGMPREKGKAHWKCRCAPDGRPLYCSIGPKRGQCE
jgi:hypothetical protein